MSRFKPDIWDQAAILLTVGQGALAFYVARYGAEGLIPMHFDIHGNADRWGERSEAAYVLGGLAVFTLVVHAGLTFGMIRNGLDKARTLKWMRPLNLLVMAFVGALMFAIGMGRLEDGHDPTALLRLIFGVVWVGMALAGASMGKVGPNRMAGVRVYWTFKSRLAWDRANRLVGRIFFYGSVVGLAALPLARPPVFIGLLLAVVLIGTVWGLFEAWNTWRNDPEKLP